MARRVINIQLFSPFFLLFLLLLLLVRFLFARSLLLVGSKSFWNSASIFGRKPLTCLQREREGGSETLVLLLLWCLQSPLSLFERRLHTLRHSQIPSSHWQPTRRILNNSFAKFLFLFCMPMRGRQCSLSLIHTHTRFVRQYNHQSS